MTDADDTVTIETILIDRITVLNPRVRDARKFAEIVESIDKVGLKQPIKVSRTTGADGEVAYNLVCGQGRMEAFLALGQTEIPAIVTDLSEQDSLIESLVENIAPASAPSRSTVPGDRRPCRTRLLESGNRHQDRLFAGTCPKTPAPPQGRGEAAADRCRKGKIPLRVAFAISDADDERAQEILVEAYEKGELTLKQMPGARRTLEHRQPLRQGAEGRIMPIENRPRNRPMRLPAPSRRL